MQNGSLQNLMAGTAPTYTPAVGDGATEICWTDRHAWTVVRVLSPKHVVVQRDRVKRTDANGMSDCQTYAYTPDPEGTTRDVTLRSNGRWVVKGEGPKNGTKFAMGRRGEYHDYSF